MRVTFAGLCVLLAASSQSADAFLLPQKSSVRKIESTNQQRPFARTQTINNERVRPVFNAKSDNDEPPEEQKARKGVEGVDEVAAEAEAALREAEKALQKLDIVQDSDSPDQLIDVDQVAKADDKETQKIIKKLATGKLAADDVTTKLLEKQNNIEEQKREEAAAEERKKLAAIEREARDRGNALTSEAINSAVGGAVGGAIAGAVADIFFMMNGIDVDPAIAPVVLGVSLAAAAFSVGKQDNEAGQATRSIVGGAVTGLTDSVTTSVTDAVDNAVDEVKAIPDNIKTAVDKKVQETTDEIKQIPDRVKDAAIETAEEITGEIKQIPDKVKDAAIQTADKTKVEIETAAKKAVEEVKATPGRVAQSTKEAVVKTVEDVEEKIEKAVEEAVALPGKTLDDITEKVSNIIPGDNASVKSRSLPTPPDMVPKPPEMPPPQALLKQLEKESVTEAPPTPKPPAPKTPAPKISIPKVNVPKIEVPKISIPQPKVVKPSPPKAAQPPSPPKAAQPPPPVETKKDDSFVFSEVSLKSFINKDKSTVEESEDIDNQKRQAAEEKVQQRKQAELASAIKKKQAAEEKRAAAEERERKLVERREAQLALAAEKQRLAEERRAEVERKRLEAEEKRAAELRAKRAESKVEQAKPGATISLGFFGFGQKDSEESKPISAAPNGVPTISNWVQDIDGAIIGTISGSASFRNGESITTSPITTKDPAASSIVQTKSGSKYYLGPKKTIQTGGFFGGSKAASVTEPKEDKQAKAREIAEEKRAAAAEARKQLAEERKAAAEARKREAEEKRQASIAAAAQRKQDIAKRQALNKVSSSTGGTISLGASPQKKQEVQKAEKTISKAKPGATISLGFFNFGKNDDQASSSGAVTVSAPRGVPTITKWRKNRDGSVSGIISGSKLFKDGDSITTSPITVRDPSGGSVVTSISGSRYFLAAQSSGSPRGGIFGAGSKTPSKEDSQAKIKELAEKRKAAVDASKRQAEERRAAAAEQAETKRREAEERRIAQQEAAAARKREAEEKRQAAIAAAEDRKAAAEAKRQASIQAAAEKKAAAEAKKQSLAQKSQETISEAKPRQTISLGFLNFGGSDSESKSTSKIAAVAPRGVPTITGWKQNRDKSITGFISGSSAYKDGESITTSPIVDGASDNVVVRTLSGSRYFLAPKTSRPTFKKSQPAKQSMANTGAQKATAAANARKKQAEEKKAAAIAAAEAKKEQAEQKRQAAIAAAEAKKAAAEEKRQAAVVAANEKKAAAIAAAEARKQQAEEKRQAALAAAAEKKAAAVAAAEARKQQAEEKRQAALAAAEARKQQAEEKRQASLAAVEAKKKDATQKKAAASAAAQKQAQAKKAQQVLSNAKSRTTISLGFLFGNSDEDSSQAGPTTAGKKAPNIVATAPRGVPTLYRWRQNRDGSITGAIYGSKAFSDSESITTSPITTDSADSALVQTLSGSKYYLAPKGTKPPASSSPRAPTKKAAAKVSPAPKKMAAPRGVPKLSKWRQNRNKSITGLISGSPNFNEGERITTSAITSGTVQAGQVVKTGSGSRYYLV